MSDGVTGFLREGFLLDESCCSINLLVVSRHQSILDAAHVSKAHWLQSGRYEICSQKICGLYRKLGLGNPYRSVTAVQNCIRVDSDGLGDELCARSNTSPHTCTHPHRIQIMPQQTRRSRSDASYRQTCYHQASPHIGAQCTKRIDQQQCGRSKGNQAMKWSQKVGQTRMSRLTFTRLDGHDVSIWDQLDGPSGLLGSVQNLNEPGDEMVAKKSVDPK